jgi:alkaline phosphatase D
MFHFERHRELVNMIRKPGTTLVLTLIVCCCATVLLAEDPDTTRELVCGPFIGHVEATHARVWARFRVPGTYQLSVAGNRRPVQATACTDHDLCVVWDLEDLRPDQKYSYAISSETGAVLAGGADYYFRTAKQHDADMDLRLFFGSCALEDEGTAAVWQQAARQRVDVTVLLGDTPYIDSADLDIQRRRYAQFASVAEMAQLFRSTPWYGTWDDHDFGLGDGDGRLVGKQRSRQAFMEYHANPSYGEDDRGIYTSFRRGPVEVFLLDTRYFAATEPSPFVLHHASLLGRAQWDWLRAGLKRSTAPVKVLACGMIWNAATRPNKLDQWGSYAHEREALFRFIGEEKVDGVLLVGGDIHRSRVLRHDTKAWAGYDIYELISSPLHAKVVASANAPHPRLVKDMGNPNSFMLLEVEQRGGNLAQLQARFLDASGQQHYLISLLD